MIKGKFRADRQFRELTKCFPNRRHEVYYVEKKKGLFNNILEIHLCNNCYWELFSCPYATRLQQFEWKGLKLIIPGTNLML